MSRKQVKILTRFLKETRNEIHDLFIAWAEFIENNFTRLKTQYKLIVTALVFFASAIATTFLLKSIVYAQGEPGVTEAAIFVPVHRFFSWIMGGGLVGLLVRMLRKRYKFFKRIFDIVFACIGLILVAPLFLLISLLIKIDSPGPVFFRQERLGKEGKIFRIWKFRTMKHNAERETGPVWAQEHDPRVTKLGLFLRKSHLDELPQLINILKGEMSLVGPRPERPELCDFIGKSIPHFKNRLRVTPGVTGLAQSRYSYGASVKDASYKLRYDSLYMKKMCWGLDFQIMVWTAGKVLTGKGSR